MGDVTAEAALPSRPALLPLLLLWTMTAWLMSHPWWRTAAGILLECHHGVQEHDTSPLTFTLERKWNEQVFNSHNVILTLSKREEVKELPSLLIKVQHYWPQNNQVIFWPTWIKSKQRRKSKRPSEGGAGWRASIYRPACCTCVGLCCANRRGGVVAATAN